MLGWQKIVNLNAKLLNDWARMRIINKIHLDNKSGYVLDTLLIQNHICIMVYIRMTKVKIRATFEDSKQYFWINTLYNFSNYLWAAFIQLIHVSSTKTTIPRFLGIGSWDCSFGWLSENSAIQDWTVGF